MAISKERFKVEDNEFDLPVADFLSIVDVAIKNFLDTNTLLSYFPKLNPFESSGSGRGKDTKPDIAPFDNVFGDNTVVIPLYKVPITKEQAEEISTIIKEVLFKYGWVRCSTGSSCKNTIFYGMFREYLMTEKYIDKYPTTHDYFKTTADIINVYRLKYNQDYGIDYNCLIQPCGNWIVEDRYYDYSERSYSLYGERDQYGKTYEEYFNEYERKMREAKGDRNAIKEAAEWWLNIKISKGWYPFY